MGVKIKVNVKGASKKIKQITYDYRFQSGDAVTATDFLDETVRITLEHYKEAETDESQTVTGDLMNLLSADEIEEKAASGKVAFGIHYNPGKVSLKKAQENARQCFADGLVALFINGERFEQPEDCFVLREGSEVTFVRLTFLAGRLW